MTKLKLFGKWTALIWLNTIFSFYLAVGEKFDSIPEVLGITCGIFTFVIMYSAIDYRLIEKGNQPLRKWLLIGVIIKAFTQLFPVIQLFSGLFSLMLMEWILKHFTVFLESTTTKRYPLISSDSFILTYATTIINGIILSLLVAILVLFIKLMATKVIPYFKTSIAANSSN